jgi:DNA-binding winged helix-turn-helix (wHTH) protein
VLTQLLEEPGEVVTREELQKRLWPADTFVDFDHSLNAASAVYATPWGFG